MSEIIGGIGVTLFLPAVVLVLMIRNNAKGGSR